MTTIVNTENCNITAQFIFAVPEGEIRRHATQRLLSAISPYVPTVELEKAIETVRYGLNIEHGTVVGRREVDHGAGVVDCVTYLPGEEPKGA